MKSSIAVLGLAIGAGVVVASPDPQVTAKAQLGKRQADPALLGYISTDGASSCKPSSPNSIHCTPNPKKKTQTQLPPPPPSCKLPSRLVNMDKSITY